MPGYQVMMKVKSRGEKEMPDEPMSKEFDELDQAKNRALVLAEMTPEKADWHIVNNGNQPGISYREELRLPNGRSSGLIVYGR